MYRLRQFTILAVGATIASAGAAQAGEIFSWNPHAVKLNGTKFSADSIALGDYSQVRMGEGGTFTDNGYLPVEGFTLGGQTVKPVGLNDPSGKGWGAYVHFRSSGTETFLAPGIPQTATYTDLTYEIVGYNGLATFDTSDVPTVGGNRSRITTLETGSLISGQLSFIPISATELAIEGSVSTTIDEVKPQFVVGPLTGFDFTVYHTPDQYIFSPPTLQVTTEKGINATLLSGKGKGANGKLATFAAVEAADIATVVPEPASIALLATGLLGLGALRRGKASNSA